ncbi:MAG: hypothetical protein OXM61_21620 [Candidatus Poribacteria bacterium]|nr:hypothetical protein [Candidatus Poribacteria bacterium]
MGYAPPEEFAPVMEEALKKEMVFQAKLAKFKEMPDDVTLNREIATLYLQRQQIEKALLISEKMPDDIELNREIGIYYLGKNEIEKALLISEKIPDDVGLNREIGTYYLSKKEFEKALLISEKMPDDVKLNNQFAIAYLGQRQLEKALPFSKKVFDNDPKNTSGLLPTLHIQLGVAYGNQIRDKAEDIAAENTKMALMHFQKVIDTYPKSDVYELAQLYLGVTYSISKQYDKSIEVLEKLVNHATDERVKLNAEANLKQVKELAAEAEDKSDN